MAATLRTDTGRVRRQNEDAAFMDEERGVFAVADGMGGHLAGEVASGMAVDAVRRIGLHMTPGDLMVPRKSVTALLGVGAAAEKRRSCETCALRETCQFTRGGRHCGR